MSDETEEDKNWDKKVADLALETALNQIGQGVDEETFVIIQLALLDREREASELRDALRALVGDSDPCNLDHHGSCQEHGPGPVPCPVAEARRLLGLAAKV